MPLLWCQISELLHLLDLLISLFYLSVTKHVERSDYDHQSSLQMDHIYLIINNGESVKKKRDDYEACTISSKGYLNGKLLHLFSAVHESWHTSTFCLQSDHNFDSFRSNKHKSASSSTMHKSCNNNNKKMLFPPKSERQYRKIYGFRSSAERMKVTCVTWQVKICTPSSQVR